MLWLFTKSLPALGPAAAFPGLERVCKENSAGEIAGVGCSLTGCPPSQILAPAQNRCGEKLDHLLAGMVAEEALRVLSIRASPSPSHGH